MNLRETEQLLIRASAVDNRLVTEPQVAAWQEILADVEYADAVVALRVFRAEQPGVYLEPGHIAQAVAPKDPWAALEDVTAAVVEASKLRALAAAGVTLEELEEHEHDVAWMRAKFGHLAELERTPFDEAGDPE